MPTFSSDTNPSLLYRQSEEDNNGNDPMIGPSAPKMIKISEIRKVKCSTITDYIEMIKKEYPDIKNFFEDTMNIIITLKLKSAKLNHKERIQIFAGILDCSESDAKYYYKALKLLYRFLKIRKQFFDILRQ